MKQEQRFPVMKLALVVDHPSPHMRDLLETLSASSHFITKTFYLTDKNPDRHWSHDLHRGELVIMNGKGLSGARTFVPRSLALISELKAFEPDLVSISADYFVPSIQVLTYWLRANNWLWFLYNEHPRVTRGGALQRIFKAVMLRSLKPACGALSIGSKGLYIYRDIIGPGKPVFASAYYRRLDPLLQILRPARRPGAPLRVVYFGRLLSLKRLDLIIEVLGSLDPGSVTLDIYGDGPELAALQKLASMSPGKVTFRPWVRWEELPSILKGYDCLVFASETEGWGMMLAEAMAAGLCVIARETIGSADLVRNGENGILLSDAAFKTELRVTLGGLASDPAAVARLGSAARSTMLAETPDKGCDLFARMSRTLIETPPGPASRSLRRSSLNLQARQSVKAIVSLAARRVPRKYTGLRAVFYHFVNAFEDNFEEHVKWLTDHFSVCAPCDDCDLLVRKDQALVIHFDDCFIGTVESACEVLARYGLRAAFFVPTAFLCGTDNKEISTWLVEKRLHVFDGREIIGPSTVRALAANGHVVGSHLHSHIRANQASEAVFANELASSKEILENLTGQPISNLAYPFGEIPDASRLRIVNACGYSTGWTIVRGVNTAATPRLAFKRDHAEGSWSLRELRYFLTRV